MDIGYIWDRYPYFIRGIPSSVFEKVLYVYPIAQIVYIELVGCSAADSPEALALSGVRRNKFILFSSINDDEGKIETLLQEFLDFMKRHDYARWGHIFFCFHAVHDGRLSCLGAKKHLDFIHLYLIKVKGSLLILSRIVSVVKK